MSSNNKYKIKNILIPQKKINYQSLYDISEKSILPCSYQLEIKPNFDNNLFQGKIEIPLLVVKDSNVIKFHSSNIQIKNIRVVFKEDLKEIKPSNIAVDDFFETILLEFTESFHKDQNLILFIEYIGVINNESHDKYEETVGFIKDSCTSLENEKRNVYYTKCLYANARRIFPCWDYPSLKIPISFSLIIPTTKDALFNTGVKAITSTEDENLKKVEFETTIPMSTMNVEFIIGEFNYIERLSEICLKNDKLPIRLCSIQSFDLKQYENILLIIEQILYFQEQYIKKEYVINKLDIFLLPNFESYTREIERNNQSVFMSTGTLGLFIFNKEKLDSIINHQNDYTALMNNPTFIFSISQEIAKTWIRNLISPYDLTEYWFFEALATNIAFLSLKESKMNFDFDLEYEFYNHYTKYALDSFKLFSPPRKEFDAYLKNTIDESQIYTGISIIKMFLDMYTIYNNIEYFYDEDEDEGEDMEVDYEEEEEEEEFDEEMELYDIKDTLREFIQRYKNRAVREGEFFRCFINHIGKYTMANIFEFWISKARGYPVVKVMKEEYNIKKNKLTLHLKQFPGFYPKEEEYEFYEYQSQYSREPRRIPIFIRLYEYDLQTGDLIKEFSYIELLYRFDQIINIPVVKKDSKRETGFFYIISEKASSFYRVIYPMESLNNILNHQNLLTSIDKYRIWDDYQLYMDYFVKKNKELKTTHEESETDILNQQLMIIQAFSKSYDTTITLEMMNTLNKILRVYSIYENGSHNLFLEKYKAFRNDTFNNIYEQVKDKIGENSMNSSILIECLKINDERILDKVKNEIISETKNKDLIPYKTWLRINAYTSTNNEDIERDYINNFINENKSQIDDFHLNLIIEKIVMKFSVNNIMSMLVQLLDKLVIGKNQGNTEELNNCIYIIKRSLIQLSERVVEPPEILQIHNNLMNWLMENFKSLVINLGYSMNLALIINATLTNLYGDNDLEKIETFFVDFLANETKQETEEVDFISYWIIEKILKRNKNVNELVKNVFEILEPSFK